MEDKGSKSNPIPFNFFKGTDKDDGFKFKDGEEGVRFLGKGL